jgi:hypothetical protein
MNVKAQGLLNAAKHIESAFGRDALGRVLRACSAPVRETYTTSTAIAWHPVSELCEFVEVAEAELGGRGKLAQEIGAAGARANMKGMLLRIALYWGKPEYLMKRVIGVWRQYNDEGVMELLEMGPESAKIEVNGIREPSETFCRILTGWWIEIAIGLGGQLVTANHPECRARGGRRCIWELSGRVDENGLGVRPKAPSVP